MWKRGGRSTALERAQAVLSTRKATGTSAATHSSTTRQMTSSQELPVELLSSHSGSSFSSVLGRLDDQQEAAHGPKIYRVPEVGRPLSSLDSGPNRFLKKTAPPAQNHAEGAVPSSLAASQTAALSRLARFDSRFGKTVQNRSASRAGSEAVQHVTKEQNALTRPGSAQPRHFVKSRPQLVLSRDGPQGQSDSSEHSAQVFGSKPQLLCAASPILPQTPAELSPSPPELSPSPPELSPSPPELSPSPPELSPSPAELSPSPAELSPSPAELSPSPPELSPSPPELSPSPPELSPSPPGPSSSAGSAHVDVHFLEELFPLDEALEDTPKHFQMNLLDIDELEPAALQEEEDAKVLMDLPDPPQNLEPFKEDNYTSDFESEIQTEILSEHVPDSGQLPLSEYSQNNTRSPSPVHSEVTRSPSPVRSEVTRSPSPVRSEVTRSPSPLSEPSYSTNFSSATSKARSPEASVSEAPRRRSQIPSVKIKPGQSSHQPASAQSYSLLMESLRQQLALTSRFINSSREHHSRLVQNLGPPSYSYTTLEDTQQYIWKLRASRLQSKKLTGKR